MLGDLGGGGHGESDAMPGLSSLAMRDSHERSNDIESTRTSLDQT